MKSLLFLLITVLLIGNVRSQTTTIEATLKGIPPKKIQLFLLYADDTYAISSIDLQADNNGRFKQTLQLPYPVFALLELDQRRHRLLLSPGRDLQLTIDTAAVLFSGKAAPENGLVHTSILDSTPFFMKPEKDGISFKKLSVTGWKDTLMSRVEAEVAETKRRVEKLKIPVDLKNILTSETEYAYQCYLTDFTGIDLRQAGNKDIDTLQSLVMQWKSVPAGNMLQGGYYANLMVGKRIRFDINQIFRKNKSLGREAQKEQLAEYLNMPFSTIDSMVKLYGERAILDARYADHHLPASIRDKIYFNLFCEAADMAHMSTCTYLLQNMQDKHPASQYLVKAKSLLQQLSVTIQKNKANNRIVIEDIGRMKSVLEVIKKYEGKVIYLDIWGTWCGPCKKEMAYVPELKKRYSGKNIVFLYIALDKPEHDQRWKEYVLLNDLEGKHYRVDRSATESFWQGAKAAGIEALSVVPRYMIIDAQGIIVHNVAERPSSQQKLYDQLDKLL
jgi:thiol-disulfide isomerase/thioredoxin